MTSNDY